MFALPFTKAAREKKRLKVVLKTAREFIYAHEDLPAFGPSNEKMNELRAALAERDRARCESLLAELDPPKSFQGCREWLDILVVSISVAMAFRAYFYEPFNIPTGSMQPTLYGNHSETVAPDQVDVWDTTPLKWGKWLMTGKMYECFRAPFAGFLEFNQTNTGHYDMRVVEYETIYNPMTQKTEFRLSPGTSVPIVKRKSKSGSMLVPTDVLHPTETGDGPYRQQSYGLPNGLCPGAYVKAGQVLWSGFVVTGDFLFVNRWLWNFRHPRRGDVMIFSTTGVSPAREISWRGPKYPGPNGEYYNLQQGTHYIKRMTGTPGETLTVTNGHLVVDGVQPMEPLRIRQIQNREKWHEKEPAYAGYAPSGDSYTPGRTLAREGDVVKLGPDEYFACGDNSRSSFDSRFWGPVPARNLCGIAGGVFWPFFNHRWGPIK